MRAYPSDSAQGSVLSLLYNTGLRIQEAVELKRFSLGNLTFIVDTQKNSLDRTFPSYYLPSNYRNFLPYVSGLLGWQTISSYTNVVRAIHNYSDKIYYKNENNILTNIYRYRYARMLQNYGYTLEQIKNEFGHLSTASTLSYLADIYY